MAEGVFGAVYQALIRFVQAGHGTESALNFVPELMYIAVRPYLGTEAAEAELRRGARRSPAPSSAK